ncbi:hypothetical protein K488DRAFT_70017 [Vararia minispora EC-137]|uniref:Uncharacterized protein n=1 Tax=Vararia minispora EC-137 TaxID=1314806 RepID=A0ACB8QNJ4_9AGAM|nr:hypothetical protein K488DRAFT_70017 [Vararia minispora EC-137]
MEAFLCGKRQGSQRPGLAAGVRALRHGLARAGYARCRGRNGEKDGNPREGVDEIDEERKRGEDEKERGSRIDGRDRGRFRAPGWDWREKGNGWRLVSVVEICWGPRGGCGAWAEDFAITDDDARGGRGTWSGARLDRTGAERLEREKREPRQGDGRGAQAGRGGGAVEE